MNPSSYTRANNCGDVTPTDLKSNPIQPFISRHLVGHFETYHVTSENVLGIFKIQRRLEENASNFVVWIVPVDDQAPLDARVHVVPLTNMV